MSKLVFVKAFFGKGKTSQKNFNCVTLACFGEGGKVRLYELFTKNGVLLDNQDSLRFGDIVEAEYLPSDYPGGSSSLCKLTVITPSPYFVG